MASRVLLRRRAAAPLMATALVGASLIPSVALAEAPEEQRSRKPIYDDYEAATPLPTVSDPKPSPFSDTIPRTSEPEEVNTRPHGPTPTDRLAEQIGKARLFLYQQATTAEDAVNAAMDRAFHLEKSFTSTVASLAPPRESGERLMPGLVYVLVAGMAGSIVTRNRNVAFRAALPLALGVGAGWLVIPVTMTNVSGLLWTYEQRFPVVAQAHLQARESIQRTWHAAKIHSDLSKRYVDDKVMTARDTVEDWVKKGK
ncbi:MICOS subunit MIC26 [Apiospora kogelbergensis]|uniref:MICOS complex subunit n=1 Tax=Apiospora kogelbergensis TaxID=1337665 RepID=A0AAW0QUI9_9PEZI